MKKIIAIVFLIVIGAAIFVQAQRDERDRGERPTVEIERDCYNSSNSFLEFRRCVEEHSLPVCFRNWELKNADRPGRDFPCRVRQYDDYREKRPAYSIDKFESRGDADREQDSRAVTQKPD